MKLTVVLNDKKETKLEFENAFHSTVRMIDRHLNMSNELYIYRMNELKVETTVVTFAAGQWKYCFVDDEVKG
jgi:hypothetical protein